MYVDTDRLKDGQTERLTDVNRDVEKTDREMGTDGRTDGRAGGRAEGQTNGCMYNQRTERRMWRPIGNRTDGQMDG